jgi:alkylation response protein AidB-like acyl-CoA dehydrogenase
MAIAIDLRAEWLDRLEATHPLVRSEAASGEADRRLTGPVVKALIGSGAMRLLCPARYGGAELDLPTWVHVVEELSRADGSTGWCAMTASATSSIAWFLDDEAGEEVFAAPGSVIAGTAAPLGRGEPTDGGHLVTGRWSWGSAVRHCRWIVGGALLADGPRLMVLEADDVTIHDTWYAAGLRATGSHDFEVDRVFVPCGRQVWPPAARPALSGPIPAFPFFGFLALGVAAVSLGIARRAMDEIEALAVEKTPQFAHARLAEQTSPQIDIATAEARLSAARAFLHDELGRGWQDVVAGRELSARRRARLRLACAHASAEAAAATRLAFSVGGGTSVLDSSPLQRCLRDSHVAGQHAIVSRRWFETYAKVRLGIPTDTQRL